MAVSLPSLKHIVLWYQNGRDDAQDLNPYATVEERLILASEPMLEDLARDFRDFDVNLSWTLALQLRITPFEKMLDTMRKPKRPMGCG